MYNLDDLKHLEIMDKIENTEAPSFDFAELVSEPTSNSLDNKIVSLCSRLKEQGFSKYAENIEERFMLFKNAGATHLYRAHDEDGKDLIEFAHPEGDVKMDEEASDGLSDVETILSRHLKMVKVIQKEPTGKLAAKYFVELIKQAGDETIPLYQIANKFKYMADYIEKNILDKLPYGQKGQGSQFTQTANQWRELCLTISNELMVNDELPEAQAIQMVKNRLQNNPISSQHAATINSVEDIDKLVNTLLNWFEDNNPVKNAEVKKNLTKEAIVSAIALVAWIWNKTNTLNQGITNNVEILQNEIKDVISKPQITNNKLALSKIREVEGSLTKLLDFTKTYKTLSVSPSEKDLEFITTYGRYIIDTVEPNLKELDNIMVNVRKNEEEGFTLTNIYRSFVASDFDDVQKAIRGLWSALLEMTAGIVKAKNDFASSKNKLPSQKDKDEDFLSSYKQDNQEEGDEQPERSPTFTDDPKRAAIAQLNQWKKDLPSKKIDDPMRQKLNTWIDAQLAEVSNSKNENELKASLEEQKKVEQFLAGK